MYKQKIQKAKQKYLHLKSEWLIHNNNELLLPARSTEYDLVFGIGATCASTNMLDYFNLRRFSNPFEWTAGMEPKNWYNQPDIHRDTRFREKINEICNNFRYWLNPKYFKYVSSWHNPQDTHHHVVNTKLKIRLLHEFPADQDIMQHIPEFISKMQRRIKHLYDAIDKSNTILIVWIASTGDQRAVLEKNVSDTDIKWAIRQIHKRFPNKTFEFVFFEPDGTKKQFEYDKIEVAPGAFRIKSNHFLINSEYDFIKPAPLHRPHIHVISEMLDNIHLSANSFQLPNKKIDL